MSLLPSWPLNVSVALLSMSMQGKKALGCHLKYLILCSKDEKVLWVWKDVQNSGVKICSLNTFFLMQLTQRQSYVWSPHSKLINSCLFRCRTSLRPHQLGDFLDVLQLYLSTRHESNKHGKGTVLIARALQVHAQIRQHVPVSSKYERNNEHRMS